MITVRFDAGKAALMELTNSCFLENFIFFLLNTFFCYFCTPANEQVV